MRTASAPRVRAVPAVTRAVAILRLLGRSRAPLGVKAISQVLGLVPSTSLHILRVLVAEELVKVDAAKQYSLGMGALSLAAMALEGSDRPVQPRSTICPGAGLVTAIGVECPTPTMIGPSATRHHPGVDIAVASRR
jgi:hypothetical protein